MHSFPAELQKYLNEKLRVFPVSAKTKRPLLKKYFQKSSCDPTVITKWVEEFPGCNWAMPMAVNQLVAVDLDTKHDGLREWDRLSHGYPSFRTRIQNSGGGGKHIVFKTPVGLQFKGKVQDGIDIKHNGFILIDPSQHFSGGFYKWTNWDESGFSHVPDWVLTLIEKDTEAQNLGGTSDAEIEHGVIRKLVDSLRGVPLSYGEWISCGMAINSALPGPDGLELFVDLTKGAAYVEGDEQKAEEKWRGFKNNDGNNVTIKSLFHVAKTHNLELPNTTLKADLELFAQAVDQALEEEAQSHHGFYERDGHLVCWHDEEIVEHFNKDFAYVKSSPATPFIHMRDTEQGLDWVFLSEKSLELRTASHKKIGLKLRGDNLVTTISPACRTWVNHNERREYDRLSFTEHDRPGEINLWAGLKIEAAWEGDCTPIQDLILKSLCNGDERKFHWFMDWLAHVVQSPFERVSTVPVLISKQGAGKGLLFDYVMRGILGQYFTAVVSSAELTARFNTNLARKLVTFIDEATWRGNKTEDGILKRMIGSPTLSIEEKFGARYEIENFSRYVIASNNPDAVAVEMDNRRYVVLEASPKLANDLIYFAPIAEAIKEGTAIRAFYAHLLLRDLTDFHPHRILEDNYDGAIAKLRTAGPVAEFWYSVFTDGHCRLWHPTHGLRARLAYEEFLHFTGKVGSYDKNLTPHFFWHRTGKFAPSAIPRVRRGAGYYRTVSAQGFWEEFKKNMKIQAEHVDYELLQISDLEDDQGHGNEEPDFDEGDFNGS
jgi:hypothetical protein